MAFCCKKELSLLPHLFTYHLSIFKDAVTDSYFIHWVVIHYCSYLFWSSNCPRFCQWSPFKLPMSFYHDSTFWGGTSLLSGIARGSSISSLLCSGIISHFSKEPWFLLLRNGMQKIRSR